jgi:hypothetical protein
MHSIIFDNEPRDSDDGVPPPIYTLETISGVLRSRISAHKAVIYADSSE